MFNEFKDSLTASITQEVAVATQALMAKYDITIQSRVDVIDSDLADITEELATLTRETCREMQAVKQEVGIVSKAKSPMSAQVQLTFYSFDSTR